MFHIFKKMSFVISEVLLLSLTANVETIFP